MKSLIFACLLLMGSQACAADLVYVGPWRTTNRPLDGIMNAVVSDLGENNWRGRFYGTWQGVDFDYVVVFTGPADDLSGTAIIDGASYKWRGRLNSDGFNGTFTGDRYNGHFELLPK